MGTLELDDPKAFPTKAEMKVMGTTKDAIVEGVKKLKMEDIEKPTPEAMKMFAPTVGHAILTTGGHWTMHVGQFQVIRRKLGKKILF